MLVSVAILVADYYLVVQRLYGDCPVVLGIHNWVHSPLSCGMYDRLAHGLAL